MIEVAGLVKNYGDVEAVKGVDLAVERGEIVAFLGPNGAGKTTTIEILEGFRPATSGHVRVIGEDPAKAGSSWRERIGIVLQESEPIPALTALETIEMQANFYSEPGRDRPNPSDLLKLVGLADAAGQRVRKLSGGQKRRLDLATALVGDPDLVFLDEPTTGFDPSARRESWAMVESLRELNKTVLLTTHAMDEAEHLSDRIVVINGGLISARGTAAELAEQVGAKTVISWACRTVEAQLMATRLESPLGLGVERNDSYGLTTCKLRVDDVVSSLRLVLDTAERESVELVDLQVINPTLEDVYLELVDEPSADPTVGEVA